MHDRSKQPDSPFGEVEERHRPMAHWAKDLYVALAGRYAAGAMVELPYHPGDTPLPPPEAQQDVKLGWLEQLFPRPGHRGTEE